MADDGSKFRVLCIHGGGYLGLAAAEFLRECERHFGISCHERFDLFCGTSTGAIISLALAKGMTSEEVVSLYTKMGEEVFPPVSARRELMRLAMSFVRSKHDNVALRRCLTEAFGETTLDDLLALRKYALVPAYCLTTGKPRIFKTDHAPNLSAHGRYKLRDIALASSAAPGYLPIVSVSNPDANRDHSELFCDGGVFANDPALLGYTEAISHIGHKPSDVQILSVSTPRQSLAMTKRPRSLRRGFGKWALPLAEIFIDGASDVSHEALRRLTEHSGADYQRFQLEVPASSRAARLTIDSTSSEATDALISIGHTTAQRARDRLAGVFQE